MPPFGIKRGAGGGRGIAIGARIPFIPREATIGSGSTAVDVTKISSLSEQIFGVEEDRRNNRDLNSGIGMDITSNYGKAQLQSTHPFDVIEDVTIDSTMKNCLRGWLYHPDPTVVNQNLSKHNYVVLFLSGSGGSAERYSREVAAFYATKGIRTLAVNYRGFGKSGSMFSRGANRGGIPTESGLYDDAYYMYLYLTQQRFIIGQNIIVHGFSLGGAVAANLVKTLIEKKRGVRGLVLQSPIVTAPKAAADDSSISSVERKLGAGMTRVFLGAFNTLSFLKAIAKKKPTLRLCLTSGGRTPGKDQLDINGPLYGSSKTFLQHVTAMGFINMHSASDPSASHTDCAKHMAAADAQGNIRVMWT